MMCTDRRAIHHHNIDVVRVGDGVHDPVPVACVTPPVEAVIDGGRRTVFAGQISPGDAGAKDVENAVDDTPVIYAVFAPCLVGQDPLDELPLQIAHIRTCHFPNPACCFAGNESQTSENEKELMGELPSAYRILSPNIFEFLPPRGRVP